MVDDEPWCLLFPGSTAAAEGAQTMNKSSTLDSDHVTDGGVLCGACVLIVDNSPMNLSLLRDILEVEGCRVLEAPDVRSAFEILRGDRPDLIVSDIHMPEETGYDFLACIKRDPALRDIPFVLSTASLWSGDPEHGRELGAAGFIVRPVDPRRLCAELGRILAAAKTPPG
jgi:CheY-like chemotaxis protein